jgi:hypothetical protein
MNEKWRKANKWAKFLDIPMWTLNGDDGRGYVNTDDLYDILMDEEKLKVLVAKLRNKAFW